MTPADKRDIKPWRISRFHSKVHVASTGCHVWTGSTTDQGYGCLTVRYKCVLAHRFAFILAHGGIPDGLTIDHLCRNRMCVNPAHLEAVTLKENVLRGVGRSAINARKTHCNSGHAFGGNNLTLYRCKDGRVFRRCKVCQMMASRRARDRRANATHNKG